MLTLDKINNLSDVDFYDFREGIFEESTIRQLKENFLGVSTSFSNICAFMLEEEGVDDFKFLDNASNCNKWSWGKITISYKVDKKQYNEFGKLEDFSFVAHKIKIIRTYINISDTVKELLKDVEKLNNIQFKELLEQDIKDDELVREIRNSLLGEDTSYQGLDSYMIDKGYSPQQGDESVKEALTSREWGWNNIMFEFETIGNIVTTDYNCLDFDLKVTNVYRV